MIADDREAVLTAQHRLRFAAGNFYVNDKPTGAVVGRQPFGGSRGSGTNDKAGSLLNLLRWTSARTIKETFVPATDHTYPAYGTRLMAGVFAHTVRPAMLAAGRADGLRRVVERSPVTRRVVRRFVPGDDLDAVLNIVAALRDSGRYVSIDYLGENVTDADGAAATVRAYLELLDALGAAAIAQPTGCGRWRCR